MDARSRAAAVRDLHNAVAASSNPAEASTRGSSVTRRELRRAARSVIRNLQLTGAESVLEIGCGTGVIAVPVAACCARFIGLDFAERAVDVLRGRFQAEQMDHATAICRDASADLSDLGCFDRIIIYATLQYVDDPADLIRRAIALTSPNGSLLLGNLPATAPVRRSPGHRAASLAYRAWRRGARALRKAPFTSSCLPGVGQIDASTVEDAIGDLQHEWLAPAVGTPMFDRRVDVIVHQRP